VTVATGKLRAGIEQITDIVGDHFEEAEIADALLYYGFDQEKTVSWLLDGKSLLADRNMHTERPR